LLVLMFTDLVGSSALKVSLGDMNYVAQIARPHNDMFRELLKKFPGAEENNYTGDGFISIFARVSDAVDFALLFHHRLRTFNWAGPVPQTRIGIHVGQSLLMDEPDKSKVIVASHAADTCARMMSLAVGGQTLLTRHACDDARQFVRKHPDLPNGEVCPAIDFKYHGLVRFKGNETEAIEVFEVGAVGISPFMRPPDSEKAHWYANLEEEALRNWLPGAGREVPGRPSWVAERKLGEGGFGEVWLVKHVQTGNKRVFKFCFDLDRLRSFQRELKLFRLLHENLGDRADLAKLIDIRLDRPPYFLESEYIEGGNLHEWIERRGGLSQIPLSDRLTIVIRIARAVAGAHSVGVIHKDIKPANILMRDLPNGQVQPILTDFGIGAVADKSLVTSGFTLVEGLSESSVAKPEMSTGGTPIFTAPEVLMQEPATTASDVYAVGIILYQMVIGDFKRPMSVGWEKDISDELLCEDIRASVVGDPVMRLSSPAELAMRLETLETRRAAFNAQRTIAVNKIHRRLSVELLLAAIIPLVVLVVLFMINTRREMISNGVAKLHDIANITSLQLDQALVDATRDAQQIALGNSKLGELCVLNDGAPAPLKQEVQRLLESVITTHPEYLLAAVIDRDGKVIATTDASAAGGEVGFREYFKRALQGQANVSDMMIGKFTKMPGVYLAAPIRGNGPEKNPDVVGVLMVKLAAKRVWNIVNDVKLGEHGYAMVVDENNIVISHPDPTRIFESLGPITGENLAGLDNQKRYERAEIKSMDIPDLMSPRNALLESLVFSAPDPAGGRTKWVAGQAWLKQKAWRVCVVEPQSQFIAPVTNTLLMQIVVAVTVGLSACAFVIWRARRAQVVVEGASGKVG
jgi:serine/threonine protein kinase/class 3 adenylate cyclase